ncbi:hypothetical protein F511_01348 [Dorcoceras hygrometricum]|uniref:Uncharacterized protein n=1 Tax=Dorcoceras hygrometricum TaxID=472368 RepID=A0A2Z7D5Y0_9LAMI|nr:hypothetical protein F511_01348 [Dorcoceras hygrometricum]
MQVQLYGLVQKSMVFLLLMTILSEKNGTMSAGDETNSTTETQQQRAAVQYHVNHSSFDAFLSSKRRVPNESDPLHNR